MSTLSDMLADGNNPDKNEATAYPYWLIIDPAKVPLCKYDVKAHYIANAITGPFFSRAAAVDRLQYASHHYSKHAIVYCASGHASKDWVKLMKMAKQEGSEDECLTTARH
jgi:hypothetical protein